MASVPKQEQSASPASASPCKALPTGAIQDVGAIVCFSPRTGQIAFEASGSGAAGLVGNTAELYQNLAPDLAARPRQRTYRFGWNKGRADVCAYRSGELDVCELVPARGGATSRVHEFLFNARADIDRCTSIEELYRVATALIREALGADACIGLAFNESGDGDVLAEDRSNDAPLRYLALRFPASDVPPPARAAFEACPVRIIFDVDAPEVPIAAPGDIAIPDLRGGILRSVAPCHLQYMRNMELGVSLSIALFVGGKLRGLVASHFFSALQSSLADVLACELLASYVGARLEAIEESEVLRRLEEWNARRTEASGSSRQAGFVGVLRALEPTLSQILDARGMAFVEARRVTCLGLQGAPEELVEIEELARALDADPSLFEVDAEGLQDEGKREGAGVAGVWACDNLAERMRGRLHVPLSLAAGALALRLGAGGAAGTLLLFRREEVKEVAWAGEPGTRHDEGAVGSEARQNSRQTSGPAPSAPLAPRTSFAKWVEKRSGRSRRWIERDLRLAEALRRDLVDINLGFIAAEVSRARGRAEAAALVLHDLGNQLTGVQGWNRELERGFERARELVASGGTVDTPMVESLASHHERLSRCLEASFELLRINRQFLRSYAQEEPAPRGFSIHEILDHVVALAPRASAAVGVRCALPERTCLDFDRSRFVRVLLNLVKNALEASDSSGQEPRVVLEALREGREVVLRVRDEGAGFDETQAKSFFVKGCTSKSEGSGLGLWASRAFVEALGGTLRLESEGPGQGAVATVRLPESLVCQGP